MLPLGPAGCPPPPHYGLPYSIVRVTSCLGSDLRWRKVDLLGQVDDVGRGRTLLEEG